MKIQITTDKNCHEVTIAPTTVLKSRQEALELIGWLTMTVDKLWPPDTKQKSALEKFRDELSQAEAKVRAEQHKVQKEVDHQEVPCSSCGLYKEHCTCQVI